MVKVFEIFSITLTIIQFQVVLLGEIQTKNNAVVMDQKVTTKNTNHYSKTTTKLAETQKKELNTPKYVLNITKGEDESTKKKTDFNIKGSFGPFDECTKLDNPIRRKIRGTANKNNSMKPPQFKQLCGGFPRQPCTCYYPDHPNVPIFELSTDEITAKASIVNGTGPSTCQDLKQMGYSLKGFHLVRFTNKRIKTIYCDFDEKINENTAEKLATKSSSKQNVPKAPAEEVAQFCGGAAKQPCKFLFSDYPDIPLLDFESKKVVKNSSPDSKQTRPTSCEDLSPIGYYLKGFYLVSLCKNKVKVIYCDFDIKGHKKDQMRLKTKTLPSKENNVSKQVLPYCQDVGSQPCSCYFSNFSNILQFELSNDEVTRSASSENGTGPQNCDELKNIGHTLDGFYLVRFKSNIIKTVYCIFTETTTQPPTTSAAPEENKCEVISFLKNLNKIDPLCLNSFPFDMGSDVDFPLPYFRSCNTNQPLQQWVFRKRTHICFLDPVDLCFTVSNSSLPPFNSSLSCLPYNETSTSQKWTTDAETNTIVNVDSKLCLAGKTGEIEVGVAKCNKEDQYQTWAFESILYDVLPTPYSLTNPPTTKCDPKFVKDDDGINGNGGNFGIGGTYGNGGFHGHHQAFGFRKSHRNRWG